MNEIERILGSESESLLGYESRGIGRDHLKLNHNELLDYGAQGLPEAHGRGCAATARDSGRLLLRGGVCGLTGFHPATGNLL